ncbi:anthranilate synthase component 2 [Striga asiatica]|uniref:Anthranilate synthase component 2 n=1 Tax=Striga asiatica TaxID=4170 RepID=A0A5A7Q7M3_STRAF|nr:anthranilate synthase component 2 [Striga asiatica]
MAHSQRKSRAVKLDPKFRQSISRHSPSAASWSPTARLLAELFPVCIRHNLSKSHPPACLHLRPTTCFFLAATKTPMAISESASVKRSTNRIVLIDNYDSFTYNLCQYMGEVGCELEVYQNDKLTVDELKRKNPRGTPQDSRISLQTVQELGPTAPLFGVCIGEAYGGDA